MSGSRRRPSHAGRDRPAACAGNVDALDMLRALDREPAVADAFFAEVDAARGADSRLDVAAQTVRKELSDRDELPYRARGVVERMALLLQAALLVRHSPPEVADAFCATRLGHAGGLALGTLPRGAHVTAILDRSMPRPVG